MVVVPAAIPVTTPEVFTIAMLVAVLLHVPPAVPVGSLSVMVAAGQTNNTPDMAPATGVGFTVTGIVAATVPQLLVTV